ncbi:hypothetical protein [Streptomyces phaeochromogenes]|uniref:Uncharacterized protein n=1 Tax=Streptomyces phaeochromogenes TaxID=1923 RepID=A0ABZ1HBR2_STRPH|nr:hypothetical protein [Streptomyces phaeochromogenes]WRZ30433.1 hypothetical protein OG931_23125 [Streptomyces phaeochromogenes]WSD16033.1 hypothetical protein OHB35_23820 [Streptomyces phaeochromogenes]
MRSTLRTRTATRATTRAAIRTAATAALFASAAIVGVLAPQAAAAQPALPLPIPVAAVEPLVTEGVSVEGPLVNNITLPTLK